VPNPPPLPEFINCEQFDELKNRWHAGLVDKVHTEEAFKKIFPTNYQKIIAWLNRPIIKGKPHNILTMEKFDE
jgi:hypothetical protein